MNTALVTGTFDDTQGVALALKGEGFDVSIWEGPTPGTSERPAPGLVDCYIQLPPVPAQWSKASAGPLLAGPLLYRLDTVAAVAPLLAPDAALVLVADEPDWDPARRQALRALAEAAVAEQAGPGRQVTVTDSGDARRIAALARQARTEARRVSLADFAPGLSFTDWRNEVFNLTSGGGTTYFGWRRPDGVERAAVLRRSVLSPLLDGEDGDHGLARAVLADALGASALDDLQESDTSLVDDFLYEMIQPLPAEGFEMPMHSVAAWVVRRSLSSLSLSV
jgi:hypothetical protein